MKNTALALLVGGGAAGADKLAREQYERALNMTDRLSALSTVVQAWTGDAQALLGDFRTMYTADPLVLDKWLALNAISPDPGVVDRLQAILARPGVPAEQPQPAAGADGDVRHEQRHPVRPPRRRRLPLPRRVRRRRRQAQPAGRGPRAYGLPRLAQLRGQAGEQKPRRR